MEYSLYLLDEKIPHPQQVAFMLSHLLGIHRIDANRQVRYATGCLLPKTTLENAQKIQEHLKSLGIASFLVPYSLSFWKTRPYLVNSLSLSPEGARTPQMHFRWEQLKLLSYGVLGHSVSAAHLLQHPRFQQLCDFSSEEMKSALKNKIIEASFENFSIEEEKKRSQSYLDLLFEEPFSYLRISRRDFHYPQRESSTQLSSLYNLHELLSQCIQWVPHVQKTPSTEEFLANPLQAQTFFEGEEHLLNYSRWFFQRAKYLQEHPEFSESARSLSLGLEEAPKPVVLLESNRESKAQTIPFLSQEPESQPHSFVFFETHSSFFLLSGIHLFCVFFVASLMILCEGFLAPFGKILPKGLPSLLREAGGEASVYFLSPLLFYFFLEILFSFTALKNSWKEKTYQFFKIMLIGMTFLSLAWSVFRIAQANA